MALGCVDAQVICVDVGTEGGPEAAARTARYARAGRGPRRRTGTARPHPRRSGRDGAAGPRPRIGRALDRGDAAARPAVVPAAARRAARGHPRARAPSWARRRGTTRTTSIAASPASRLRTEVLPLLEEVLGGGVAEALARTATALREDTETLDELADAALAAATAGDDLDTGRLTALPTAVRRRVIRRWLLGRRRDRTDRQTDPRGRRSRHRLAGPGRGGGGLVRCAASGCSRAAATAC